MGIYANIERLAIKAYREYDSIEEAMDNGKFRLLIYLTMMRKNTIEKIPE